MKNQASGIESGAEGGATSMKEAVYNIRCSGIIIIIIIIIEESR